MIAPVPWLFTTVFAAGLLSALWRAGSDQGAWALVGFAGVLAQNATFTSVGALRFGMAAAAAHGPDAGGRPLGHEQRAVRVQPGVPGYCAAGLHHRRVKAKLIRAWHAVLGYAGTAMLFASSLASPYAVDGANPLGTVGLIGWFAWAAWIVAYSITLVRR